MPDKEKADCLIELHKEHMNHFKQTRDIEFKVNIALWTLIVVAGRFLILTDLKNTLIPIVVIS